MNHQPEFASTINLLDVVRGMGRRKLVIMVFTLLALCAGLAIVKFLKPTYSTEAQILIENLASPFDRTQSPDQQQPDPVDDRVIKEPDVGAQVAGRRAACRYLPEFAGSPRV